MAVSASAFGTRVIRSLDDLLQGRLRRASPDLRDNAEKLRSSLVQVLSYSVEAENQVLEEDHARQWLAELRQVLYKADQLLEAYGADALVAPSVLAQVVQRFSTDRYLKHEIRTLHKMMVSIYGKCPTVSRSINKEKGQHYESCKQIFHGDLLGTNIELIPTLVGKLTENHDPSQRFILFAILGLGGMGKTTIARKIFDDQRTRSAFSTRLWVSISKGSTVAQVLLAICAAIEDLKGSETRNAPQKLLADKIRGRRIFLVFNLYDGVSSKGSIGNTEIYGKLIEILRGFRHASEGSRVLITTSDENVGNAIKSAQINKAAEPYGVEVHRLRQLSVEDGWTLLLQACLDQGKVTPDLKNIGIEIVQKCNGLPLAIMVVGGVLARKSYKTEEWKAIHDSSAFSLKDPTTGIAGGVRSSIYLSYQDALPHLKQCFNYLSSFPPDFKIEKHMVTQLWISEGLIDCCQSLEETRDEQNNIRQEESNRQNNGAGIAQEQDINLPCNTSDGPNNVPLEVSMDEDNIISLEQDRERKPHSLQEIVEDHGSGELIPKGTPSVSSGHSSNGRPNTTLTYCSVQETSDRFFEELVERGLLQQYYNATEYKMHEQVRKIAEPLTENESFAGDPKDVVKLSATLQHLSFVDKGLTTIPEEIRRLSNLRTLLLSGNPLGEKDLDLNIIFKNLKLLRVLDLSDTEISSIPKTLCNLVHLRHLNLSCTKITALPDSIGSLRRLRFLGLQKCEHLGFLPKNIQKLSKLEYLNLQDSREITTLPRLQNLQCLTFLHGFVVNSVSSSGWQLKELQNMSKLASLQIKIKKIQTVVSGEVLKEKNYLRNLELSCCTDNSETVSSSSPEEQHRLEELFKQLHPHQCLGSLKIDGYYASAYPEWLSKLSNLQQLNLVNCEFCAELPPLYQLTKLEFLRLSKLSKLKEIDMQRDRTSSFPNLTELHIEDMPNLESLSAFRAIDRSTPLRKFSLTSCPILKHVRGLEHCKIATMEVRGAGLLAIENLSVQELIVESMPNLITLSNLPLLKVLTVTGCPILGEVSEVSSLRHIHIEDERADQLPKWLEQHASGIETLDLVGNAKLLGRCERSNKHWPIICEIPRVYTYLPGREAFFSYIRSNDYFFKHQSSKAYVHEDPSAAVDQTGASVPASSEGSNDSAREPAGGHRTDRAGVAKTIAWVVVVLIFTLCYNLDPSEAVPLWILFSIAVCVLFMLFISKIYV